MAASARVLVDAGGVDRAVAALLAVRR
jgi:hypothetical protein